MKKLKLAFLCDIDNAQVTVETFNGILEKFSKSSEIVLGKIYGYADRKHKGFLEVVNASCFDIASTMRYKKRSSQQDIRIVIDAVELAARDYLDGFVIVGGEGDFAPLLSYLKGRGKFVAGAFRNSENYLFCDEIVELPAEEVAEKPKRVVAPKAEVPAVKAEPAPAAEPVKAPAAATSAPKAEPVPAPAPEAATASAQSKGEDASTSDIFSELEKIVREFASKNK